MAKQVGCEGLQGKGGGGKKGNIYLRRRSHLKGKSLCLNGKNEEEEERKEEERDAYRCAKGAFERDVRGRGIRGTAGGSGGRRGEVREVETMALWDAAGSASVGEGVCE